MAESEGGGTGEAPESGNANGATPARSHQERIERTIRRARKLAGPDFDDNREQVEFMIEEARILAILDVASALRGDQGDDRAR
jgi:hypothetical protein